MLELLKIVDDYKDLILEAERHIWENPETGYKEFKTNEYMISHFEKMGYKLTRPDNITGFYTVVDTGKEGPTVLILAELDSLRNEQHPECNPETKNVHNCGHHAQCAAMLGVAAALTRKEILDKLCGKIKLCVVPAEEGIEIGYRKGLIKEGVIKFTSGKPEFISRRFFDDVDIAYMVHTTSVDDPKVKFKFTYGHNGVIRKSTTVRGKASHAGANPHQGINALNAANLMLLAINSLRETFEEKDYVRVHSIITNGGAAVNAVPDEVTIESYVRAGNSVAIKKVNDKVNRTIAACAAAFGASVEIEDLSGSEAVNPSDELTDLAEKFCIDYVGKDGYIVDKKWTASSTDMGDITSLFPAIHAYVAGATGTMHGKDYYIVDPYTACVESAKFQIGLLMYLLSDKAKEAKKVIDNFVPAFKSVDEYLAFKRSLNMHKQTVKYNEDGTITLDFRN